MSPPAWGFELDVGSEKIFGRNLLHAEGLLELNGNVFQPTEKDGNQRNRDLIQCCLGWLTRTNFSRKTFFGRQLSRASPLLSRYRKILLLPTLALPFLSFLPVVSASVNFSNKMRLATSKRKNVQRTKKLYFTR